MKNENNKRSEDFVSETQSKLDSETKSNLEDLVNNLSKKNEQNPLYSFLTKEELNLLADKLKEFQNSPQITQVVETPVEKNIDKKSKNPINIQVDATSHKNKSNKSRNNSFVSKEPFLDIGEKQPVPAINLENKPKSALTEVLKKLKETEEGGRENEKGKKDYQQGKVEDNSQTGNKTEDKSQETRVFELSSSSDEEILNKSSISPEIYPKASIEVFPTNRTPIKRSEIKKPDPSVQEKGIDNTISQARKAAMPEEPLNSESQATPGVEQPEASVSTEIKVEGPENAVGIPTQYIGIPPGHPIPYWSPRITYGVPTLFLLFVVLSQIPTLDLFTVFNTKPKVDVGNRTRSEINKQEEEKPEKVNNERPSIFIFTYLLKGPVKLAQWLVATRDLPELDKRIKKSMISRVVAIIDEDRNGVIVEVLLSDFSTFTSINNHISSFVELSRLDELLLMIELIIMNSEESFPARLVRDALLGAAKDILPL